MTSKPEFDLCVIGGGAAGLTVAAGGAALGAKVVLVEKHRLGGDCLYYGCVPSKSLLHAAKVAHTARRARRFGVECSTPVVHLSEAMRYVRDVITDIEPNDSPERFRRLGVEVIFGAGEFTDPRTFRVNGRDLTAKNFVLATGSRPALPDIPGLTSAPYLTNETVFDLREPVPSLMILGAGPIGVEMAQAFARLGSKVTLVQRGTHILPREDADLARVVADRLSAEGVTLHLGCAPLRVEGVQGDLRLRVKPAQGSERALCSTHLLLAIGRTANVEHLGLERAGVRMDHGRVATDRRLRTGNKRIYACGDVVGSYQFTHVAEHHAGVVLRNALFHLPAKVEQRVIPWCTFTDPELARVGLSETEAKRRGIRHRIYTFPFHDIDRARAEDETQGFAKLITAPNGRLLGAALVGTRAGELIHEYALALSKNMKAADLSKVIHVYPTLAQINRRVADQRFKQGLTAGTKKWIKRLFRLRGQ
jgi:pyruvate/2-oxoglutarate dehydrogenase complex dihydrolipoamide dehydrogenase (E3) component